MDITQKELSLALKTAYARGLALGLVIAFVVFIATSSLLIHCLV